MSRTALLELEGMEFHANHGCFGYEAVAGNLFIVDFKGTVDIEDACRTDELGDALDYGKIYDMIAEEMKIRSNLIEHVAGRIVDRIASGFPQLGEFSIRVSKRRPAVNGVASWSRISLTYKRK